MKKILLALIFFSFLIPVIDVSGDTELKQIPVVETLDLLVNGSTPIRFNLSKDFDFVVVVIFHLDYDDPNYIPSEFAEAGPLPNGIFICVENTALLDFNITDNEGLTNLGFETTIFQDDKVPKATHVFTRFSFQRILPPFGLSYTSNDSFFITIQDDLTVAALDILEFEVHIAGFRFETIVLAESFTDDFFLINFLNNLALLLTQYWIVVLAVSGTIIVLIKIFFF